MLRSALWARDKTLMPVMRRSGLPLAAIAAVALLATLAGGCSGGSKKSSNSVNVLPTAAVVAPSRINCFDGVTGYRFSGHLSLQGGSSSSSIGSLANLLSSVDFQGAFHAPDDSTVALTFPGANGSQDLELRRVGGQLYQRAAGGAWQKSTGQGPIVSTVARLDPLVLCQSSLANANLSAAHPHPATVAGKPALHYTLSGSQLAATAGPLGARGTSTPEANATVDVWLDPATAYPVQMQLATRPGGAGEGTLNVMIDVTDVNGTDTAIAVPTP